MDAPVAAFEPRDGTSLAIQQKRGRHGHDAKGLARATRRIAGDSETDGHAVEKGLHRVAILLERQSDDPKSAAGVLRLKRIKKGKARPAGNAPGGPEVENDHVSLDGGERERVALPVGHFQRGRRLGPPSRRGQAKKQKRRGEPVESSRKQRRRSGPDEGHHQGLGFELAIPKPCGVRRPLAASPFLSAICFLAGRVTAARLPSRGVTMSFARERAAAKFLQERSRRLSELRRTPQVTPRSAPNAEPEISPEEPYFRAPVTATVASSGIFEGAKHWRSLQAW